jgi:multimeric flavodoxin WrbA
MKAVFLSGVAREDAAGLGLHALFLEILLEKCSQVEPFLLSEMEIAYCTGDFKCWLRSPGVCNIKDDNLRVAASVAGAELVVFFTRVTFGGYSSHLKKMVDHLLPNSLPLLHAVGGEVRRQKRYDRYPYLLVAGLLPQPDPGSEKIFHQLAQRNARTLFSPGFSSLLCYEGQEPEATSQALCRLLDQAGLEQGLEVKT